jgi:hypothetical protein
MTCEIVAIHPSGYTVIVSCTTIQEIDKEILSLMQKGYLPARESTLPPEVAAAVSAPVDLARSHVVDGTLVCCSSSSPWSASSPRRCSPSCSRRGSARTATVST